MAQLGVTVRTTRMGFYMGSVKHYRDDATDPRQALYETRTERKRRWAWLARKDAEILRAAMLRASPTWTVFQPA